ncbi:cytochrome d ubiquinol oxidase subunit I [Deinobacterium chartae]|uniref:Cytochrome d ubiquinol oxidase subunit I n=1 Tax=Deinobacterium chartae TaxID=521158 RepID=A0A841HZI8_9DEIO|nr:cytochrome ubiquinol oxidase subunit I [Deinobacterium chartae]MBB6097302.1 cytochrome d ubiquinol oxidase subunit I [Deinobacterium chartae]
MDVLDLSRFQFATTNIFHFFFVPFTVGLSLIIATIETFAYFTRLQVWGTLTRFFGHLFVINFAVGVVTGIVQEFQFGMNWAEYARFVGNIFGVPLALEVLMAFFLESTFLGLWWFGRDRLPRPLHLASIWLVALGSTVSAFWIIMANAWMQHPVGYTVVGDEAHLTSFAAVALNYKAWLYFGHIWFSALCIGSFFVLGVSAWHLARGHRPELFSRSLKLGVAVALLGTVGSALVGHRQGQVMVVDQPMKFAAIEAIWETTPPGAGESIFALPSQSERRNLINLELPYLGSFLAYNSFDRSIRGINDIEREYDERYGPGDYTPPVWPVYWSFRVMVGLGLLMLLTALVGVWLWWRGRLETSRRYLRFLPWMIPAPFIANFTGWIATEMGRQPWIVQGLMFTRDGVSALNATTVFVGLIGFWLVYLMLIGLDIYLLGTTARAGIHAPEHQMTAAPAPHYLEE